MSAGKAINASFNPSFTGIALVAKRNLFPYTTTDRFQSFFYWNCLGGGLSGTWGGFKSACFNPSFTGIALVAY